MKTIENKVTVIAKSQDVMATYADLLTSILNKPLQKTVTIKEMRRDIKLIDKFEEAKETIEVTDEEFKYLVDLVETSEWALKHNDILEFAEYIESLK
jgi:hypothetical protein